MLAHRSGYTLVLPPLRERREDPGLLVAALLPRLTERPDEVRFSVDAARLLLGHPWPLNVRELANALASATVIARGRPLEPQHLPASRRVPPPPARDHAASPPLSDEDARLRDELIAASEAHGGSVSAVARAMGKARNQVQRWMKRLAIDPARFRR